MNNPVLIERRDDGIAILTLNRPEMRNPISDQDMIDALVAALEEVDRDISVKVAILTGAGSAFSAGGNLAALEEVAGSDTINVRHDYRYGIQRLPLAFEAIDIPVIAAVNGPAIGAGCDLACMCDLRVAAENAWFAESFVKVGLIPGDGGAWLLPRVVGFARATEMALTGDRIEAAQALEWGLVSQVVPDTEVMSAALGLAARIAANPVQAVRLTRLLLREAHSSTLSGTLKLSVAIQSLVHTTPDHREAIGALREKRRPDFRGHAT